MKKNRVSKSQVNLLRGGFAYQPSGSNPTDKVLPKEDFAGKVENKK